jgi:hypothetical protein
METSIRELGITLAATSPDHSIFSSAVEKQNTEERLEIEYIRP